MKIALKNKKTDTLVFSVPEFKFGQLQRWKNFERSTYVLEINSKEFTEKFSKFFFEFRKDEIEEEDCLDLEELVAYKNAGRPTLKNLLNNNLPLLADLIMYLQYELLHLIIDAPNVGKLFYSINSIDKVAFSETKILIKGICFKVDRR